MAESTSPPCPPPSGDTNDTSLTDAGGTASAGVAGAAPAPASASISATASLMPLAAPGLTLWPDDDPLQAVGVPATTICGVDEAGRGPLAGPVVAAAVILDPERPIAGLADSKVLTEEQRDALALRVREHALAWCIASADVAEIDQLNILQATLLAMQRAVQGLAMPVRLAQIDGDRAPRLPCSVQLVIKGDARVATISAASILAKTARDGLLRQLHERWPRYEFASHKGYGTAAHRAALATHGASPEHRRSFRPVREALEAAGLPLERPSVMRLLGVLEKGGRGLTAATTPERVVPSSAEVATLSPAPNQPGQADVSQSPSA